MKTYIGVKQIAARAMHRAEYTAYRGWELPANEDGADAGYLVEYLDGGKPNDPRHAGYISWSPKEQFDNAYRETSGMSFGLAIEALKMGKRVARAGWNGKGMWLAMQPGSVITPEQARGGAAKGRAEEGADSITILPHIDMRAADESIVVGWLASQTDMLADDWQIVEAVGRGPSTTTAPDAETPTSVSGGHIGYTNCTFPNCGCTGPATCTR